MQKRLPALLWCAAVGVAAFICLDFWSQQNAPLYKKFERQWAEDVKMLEATKKLPGPWFDVKTIDLIGGTPETRDWLKRIQIPVHAKEQGHYKLEILTVAWEEDGKRGVLVQYDLVDLKSLNNVWELGRTLILSEPKPKSSFAKIVEEFTP